MRRTSIYKIDEKKQFVFKISKLKMQLAREMQPDGINYMNVEFCFFHSNHKRVKSFVTLTATTYDSLLLKQIALAILECKHEGTENIEVFWRMFNSAFKELNVIGDRFSPTGFCMDMATANFNGVVKIYGEEILEKVKECEFYFCDLISRKASTLGEYTSKFKEISLSMLTSTTPEAYLNALKNMQDFINKDKKLADLQHWLSGIIVKN